VYTILTLGVASTCERDLLKSDTHLMQHVAVHPAIIVCGLVASTISSALGALVGSARVIQALAADELLPPLKPFKQMSRDGEPRMAILLSWAIAQALLFIGDLNAIAALCTNFFLLVYFAINFACLGLKLAGVPNFRPRFKYFTWWTALLGAVASLGIALYLNWIMTSISIALLGAVAVYIYFFTPAKPWGDVSQGPLFICFLIEIDSFIYFVCLYLILLTSILFSDRVSPSCRSHTYTSSRKRSSSTKCASISFGSTPPARHTRSCGAPRFSSPRKPRNRNSH
jgi:amino acid transporter